MPNQNTPNLFIYTALECEAKPLLKHFELKKDSQSHPFSIYKNENTILTVSGVGKTAMAGAVAYTQAVFQNHQLPVLVNLGISGHKFHAIGELLLASKIVDKDSGKRFYPQLIGNDWPTTCEVQTSSIPCIEYSASYMNDMEASAFYETAARFSSSELIHSIKVISDNEETSIKTIHPKLVSQWISHHLIQIEHLFNYLISLQQSITYIELKDFSEIINQWHFTVSGQIKLKSLLLRWQNLSTDSWLNTDKAELHNSKEVLQKLEKDINYIELHL